MELYLVRHGFSEGNAGVDKPDPALTDLGRKQAAITADYLCRFPIGIVVSSPMLRALETGAIIAQRLGVEHHVHADLTEKDGGDWPGMAADEIKRRFPGVVLDPGVMAPDWRPVNETTEAAYVRAGRVEKMVRDRWEQTDSHALLISHGTFGAIMIGVFLDCPAYDHIRFSQHNCCRTQLEVIPDRRAKLRYLNRIDHLPEDMWT